MPIISLQHCLKILVRKKILKAYKRQIDVLEQKEHTANKIIIKMLKHFINNMLMVTKSLTSYRKNILCATK